MNNILFIKTFAFIEKCFQTFISLFKILLLSKRIEKPNTNISHKEVVILGNGPSLRDLIEAQSVFLKERSLLAVNYAVLSDYYTKLCPEYYVVADSAFFFQQGHCDKLFDALVTKTTWNLKLYVSVEARKSCLWQRKLKGHTNIEIYYFNMTPIEGFRWFTQWSYKNSWGMPRPRNVLIPAIMIVLQKPFETIYIAGADHSWLKEIWVNDDNIVMEDLNHFYDKKGSERYVSNKHLHDLLYSMYIAFKSYHSIKDYADKLGKQIFNVTDGSYIDAFVRKRLK